jgi:RND superfamily putative drug exporter
MADPRESSRTDAAFAALARFSVRLRWPLIGIWLAAAIALPQLLPSLSSQTKANNSDFLPKGAPSLHAAELARPFQARNAFSTLLVAGRADRPLSGADQAAFDRAEAAVGRVGSVLDVRDQGLSPDRRARRALVEFRPNVQFNNADALFSRLRAVIGSAGVPPGLSAHFAGPLAQAVDSRTQDKHNRALTSQLSILFIVVLLLVVFRAALAPLITLLPAGLSLVVAGPLIGLVAEAGVEVSSLTQILLTVLVLGAGTDYGLFLIYRVREELAAGTEPHAAVSRALSRVGETISFSAACVVFALLSLVFADFGLYRGLGPGLAIGIAVVLLAGLTLLPALLAIFGRAAFWPTHPRPGHEHRSAWGRLASRVIERPRRTLVLGVGLFVALALALFGYQSAGFGSRPAPKGSDSAAGQRVLDAHYPVTVRNPTNVLYRLPHPVWNDPGPAVVATRALAAAGGRGGGRGAGGVLFLGALGPLDPNGSRLGPAALVALHRSLGPPQRLPPVEPPALAARIPDAAYNAYRAAASFVSVDGQTIQFYVRLRAGDPASTAALAAVPAIRQAVAGVGRQIGALDQGVAGQAAAAYDINKVSTRDLQRIVPLVLLVIALLLALLLRSLVAPLYLIVSVGLSYLAGLGLAVAVFIGLGDEAGLNFVLPFFMFVFLMALGSDYNILVMTRIREEAGRLPLHAAVRRAMVATGGTVTSAGLVLAGTFAVLTATGDSQSQQLGLGLAAGVLLDTFFVRTLMIPSAVLLLGRRNWWPSRLAREPAGQRAGAPTADTEGAEAGA